MSAEPITFNSAINTGFRNTFRIDSLTTRKEYWFYYLFVSIVFLAESFMQSVNSFGLLIENAISIVLAISMITCGIRRLHDSGRTGWLLLLPLANLYFLLQPSKTAENKYIRE
jgi:uncharacterized membrane protein YhaH (DUF805 family)